MTSLSLSPLSGSPASVKNEIIASPHQPTAASTTAPAKPASKSKPRKRVNTAEKRHQHNAIERARRETLNSKFLVLARLLPSLASHRRPSKSAIVNGSISHLTYQRDQRLLASKLLRQLCSERDELFNEVNEWRKASGYAPKEGGSAWSDEMDEVCSVEKEVFGTFASMEGDDEGDDDAENSVDMSNFGGMPMTGLITPRSSTEMDSMAQHNQLFSQAPAVPHTATAGVNGMNWSRDFAFNAGASNGSLPFSAFMSDNLSSTDSPTSGSNLGASTMLTPPTTADGMNIYTHTPSPGSSAGMEEKVPSQSNATGQWTAQQMLFLQQVQQQQAHVQRHPSYQSSFPMNGFNPNQPHGIQPGQPGSDAFSQSLLATMFPQQSHVALSQTSPNAGMGMGIAPGPGSGTEQVQQWRKAAVNSLLQQHAGHPDQPSMADLKNAVRTGMGLGLGMASLWGQQGENTVEGF